MRIIVSISSSLNRAPKTWFIFLITGAGSHVSSAHAEIVQREGLVRKRSPSLSGNSRSRYAHTGQHRLDTPMTDPAPCSTGDEKGQEEFAMQGTSKAIP